MSTSIYSIGAIAGQTGQSVQSIKTMAARLGLTPTLTIDSVPHYSSGAVDMLAAFMQQGTPKKGKYKLPVNFYPPRLSVVDLIELDALADKLDGRSDHLAEWIRRAVEAESVRRDSEQGGQPAEVEMPSLDMVEIDNHVLSEMLVPLWAAVQSTSPNARKFLDGLMTSVIALAAARLGAASKQSAVRITETTAASADVV